VQQPSRCDHVPRLATAADAVARIADYVAGYADAQADRDAAD
jgi:hypothetical protein